MMTHNTLSDTLRDAIQSSGMTCYVLANKAGLSQSVLSRFLSGERDISLGTAGKLADALGLELVTRSARPAAPKRKPAAAKETPDILRIIGEIDPGFGRGALVTFSQIRPHCGLSKKAFDAELLRLARADLVCLHRHDFPHSLKPDERDQLVRSENEYFIGCARRRR
ncbi:MAG: helix-turn-helix domain-containing protein [Planctomyces sp.]|jgi:transcriptional regulator with XRE-family HTH domain